MQSLYTIWHNPACSTSRKALAALEAAGINPQIIRYLDTGWTEDCLTELLAEAGMTPAQALRRKAPLAAELGLLTPETPDAAILAAMLAHPVLVERPFLRSPRGTALLRPPARIEDLLP